MKKMKIIYWTSTILIFLFEGVMSALTFQTEMAKEGIKHLGYPEYFGTMLMVFKVIGTLALVIPQVPKRVKEWAYAGLAIDFMSASISLWIVDGFNGIVLFPMVVFGILILSYVYFHKLNPTFETN